MRNAQQQMLDSPEQPSAAAEAKLSTPDAASERVELFLYPLGVMLLLIGGLIARHATHGGLSSVHIYSTLAIAYLAGINLHGTDAQVSVCLVR
jgi:hypothetical protein